MKACLVALLALATSASASHNAPFSSPGASTTPKDIGSTAERGLDFVRGGVSVFDHLNPAQRNDVRACRLAQDVTSGIRAAVDAAAAAGWGRVVFPDGCYRTTGTITLPSDVELVGASMRATKLVPNGNFPAILAAGTYARGLTGVGVQNMSIICAGMSNADAMGVKLVYVNRGKLKDLYFNGCHHALDLYDQWQTTIDNVTADGLGKNQNQVGVYMGPPTDPDNKAPNNAVLLSNSTMQNVGLYGYHLVFFAGSKFFNDEAMNGLTAWKLCGEQYIIPGQACQFGHFDNIVADTTSGPGIVIDQGQNTNPVNNVMLDHAWIGNSHAHGIYIAGVTYAQFDNVHITGSDNGAYVHNSNNIKISINVAQYNRNDNRSYAAVISGGSNNTLWATNNQSDHPTGYNGIAEVGPAHANSIWGGIAPCTLELAFESGRQAQPPTYAARSCTYEIQGRQVRMKFHLGLSGFGSASGPAMLTGLPLPAETDAPQNGAIGGLIAYEMNGLGGAIVAQVVPGGFAARLFSQGTTGPAALTQENFTASSTLSGTLEYTKK